MEKFFSETLIEEYARGTFYVIDDFVKPDYSEGYGAIF